MTFRDAVRFIDTNEDKSEVRQLLVAVAQRLGALHEIDASRICAAAARALEQKDVASRVNTVSRQMAQTVGNSGSAR